MSTKKHTAKLQDFNRLLKLVIPALGALLLVLVMVNLLSGPRLRNANIDLTKVTTESDQRIVLHVNQPLTKVNPSAVHISPAAAFSVANSADTITISLKQRLKYNTAYEITIYGIAGASRPQNKSDFSYRFTTPDPALYYLKREAKFDSQEGKPDQIVRTTLYGTSSEIIFSAPKIIDYTIVGNSLVISYAANHSVNKLSVLDLASKKISDITLSDSGTATQLHGSSDGTAFGFAYSSPPQEAQHAGSYYNTLFTSDTRPGYTTVPIAGIGGKQISVFNWQFAPDGTSLVAHLTDQSLLLVDGNFEHAPVPLGEFSSISNFSLDGTKLLVASRDGFSMLDLIRHSTSPVPNAQITNGQDTLLGMLALPTAAGYLRHYQVTSTDRTTFSDYLRVDQTPTKKVIYDTTKQKTNIQKLDLSPNGQLAIIETTPDGSVDYDGYPYESRSLQVRTQLLDTVTGATIKEVNGIEAMIN